MLDAWNTMNTWTHVGGRPKLFWHHFLVGDLANEDRVLRYLLDLVVLVEERRGDRQVLAVLREAQR